MRTNYLFAIFISISITAFAQDFRYGKVSVEELQEQQHPIEPDADAAILYREVKSYVRRDGGDGFRVFYEVFERIKIYNSNAFDWGTKEIRLYRSSNSKEALRQEKAAVYNLEDGKVVSERLRNDGKFKEERSKFLDVVKYTMPNVREGSVIEYSYTLVSPFLNNIDEFELQFTIPTNEIYVRFSSPEYFTYKMHQKGWVPINSKESSSETHQANRTYPPTGYIKDNEFEITQKNVPSLREEPYMGSLNNYKSGVKFELSFVKFPDSPVENYTISWDGVTKQIYESNSFGAELNRMGYFKKDIDELLNGAAQPEEKLFKTYEFVKNRMTWNGYIGQYTDNGVNKAYREGVGNVADINLMLTAMLNYSGIEAYPVLVSTKSNGIPFFPTLNGFNYVIVAANIKGNAVLLDATDKLLVPNMLKSETINWQGRIVKRGGESEWISLYGSGKARQNTMMQLEIMESLNVKGNLRKQYTEHFAFNYRRRYKDVIIDDIIKNIESNSGIVVSELEHQNMADPYSPLMETYEVYAQDQVEAIGDKIYFSPLFFLTTKENPFKSEERNFPVDYSYPWETRYMVNVKLPEGYEIEFLPENIHVVMPDGLGEFKYLISGNNQQIQVSVQQNINESLIQTNLYVDLKEIYQRMVDKVNEKIVLVKT
jgi:hypothetical protein